MSDTAYELYQQYGTNAERLAFTPVPPGAPAQPIYIWHESDTGNTWLYFTSWVQITSGSGVAVVYPEICEGRLTTESGVPISITDRLTQGTIYFTPCTSNGIATTSGNISLYNGTILVNKIFTQLSLALTITSDKNYDVFVDYNSGTPQLVLSAAWTNDTTRADALGVQSGIVVKSGTSAYRWVGTIRASGANTTEDSAAKRFVWNLYNQAPRFMKNAIETTNTWNYTLLTWRQANANAANQLAYVTGNIATAVNADVVGIISNDNNSVNVAVGIGIDSTSVNSAFYFGGGSSLSFAQLVRANYKGYPGLGYHFLSWLEISTATGTTAWYGDAGLTVYQAGISGEIWN